VQAETYDFQIICNGNPVGTHKVVVEEHDGFTDVSIAIDLSVSLAGLELYRYHHVSHEEWDHGRLFSLESKTNDDGTELHLSVRRREDGQLDVDGSDGVKIVSSDIIPTSYWNPEMIRRHEVLDSQSGKILKVTVTPLFEGRYKMTGDLRLQLDYPQGRWNGVHFSYIGADIDYVPRTPTKIASP
jgi:hypothetical protein